MNRHIVVVFVAAVMLVSSGCAHNQELVKSNLRQRAIIESLSNEIDRLNADIERLAQSEDSLAQMKTELEMKLTEQMANGDLNVSMEDRGIVVTILNKILFEPGRSDLKSSAAAVLASLADTIHSLADDQMLYVEGHTDSDPIKYSKFRSNWELSVARSAEVVHYFIDSCKIDPEKLAICGYGQYHPVASNDTVEGKAKNRRVEIIISPLPRRVIS